jgi:hypothetical protein
MIKNNKRNIKQLLLIRIMDSKLRKIEIYNNIIIHNNKMVHCYHLFLYRTLHNSSHNNNQHQCLISQQVINHNRAQHIN